MTNDTAKKKDELLSVRQAAARTPYTDKHIYEMIRTGQIQFERVGGHYYIRTSEIDRFKASRGKRSAERGEDKA